MKSVHHSRNLQINSSQRAKQIRVAVQQACL
jgi:hypothetical protein